MTPKEKMTILMLYSTFGDERFGEYVSGAA